MIEFFKKYKYVLITIFVILLFLVPFGIHCIYKIHPQNEFYASEWSAGELLNFYGSILSFLGTVGLGLLAIWQNQIIEQKSIEYSSMIQQIEMRKNLPRLKCIAQGSNGNFTNLTVKIVNISENIASENNVANFEVRDEKNKMIGKSTQAKLDKDVLFGGESLIVSFINEALYGNNLNISFQITCIDKYNNLHIFKAYGCIRDSQKWGLKLETIEMEEHNNV